MELLCVAAHPSELEPLAGWRGLPTQAVGVGPLEAALGTAHLLSERRPDGVILLGSCGLYPSAGPWTSETLVVPGRLRLADGAVAEQRADFVPAMPTELRSDRPLCERLCGGGPTLRLDVANTSSITTDDSLATRLAQHTGCGAENLEAFAVARACALADVPFAALLAVTNDVGSRGRGQWTQNRQAAAASTAARIRALF